MVLTGTNAPRVTFDHVCVAYDGSPVIADISLTIEPGSLVVLLGPSGSGKTTLLRTINRMVDVSAGQVRLDGIDVRELDRVTLRRSIGYVMQASGLFPHQNVADNITTVPRLNGMRRAEARALAERLLERVSLPPNLAARYPGQLSGGQQQRVGVARALAGEPRLLLMDEPFAAVDPITRRELQRQVLQLHNESGATIVFVTHDVDEALLLADRIVIIRQGGIIAQDATPAEILAAPADDFVADLIGTSLGKRTLQVRTVGGVDVIVDDLGRPLGVLNR